jgi:two-component system LytT family sensor kinase
MENVSFYHDNNYRAIIRRAPTRWFVLIGAWTAFGTFMGWQSYYQQKLAGGTALIGPALFSELVYAYLWAALTPVIFRLAWKFPLDSRRWLRNGSLHLVLGAAVALLHKSAYHLIVMSAQASETPIDWARFSRAIWSYLDYGVILYLVLILIYHAVEYYRLSREQEMRAVNLAAQLTQAQLQTLRMQLHPHFLFNTLNAISVLTERKPETARAMIGKLSELLRLTLAGDHQTVVTLRNEHELLGLYLEIEKIRFEDRLTISLLVGPETLDALIPSFLLQPFVENSMRYGVAKKPGPAQVELRTAKTNGLLRLEILDNGPGIPPATELREGIGFSNTRHRLEQLFGNGFTFTAGNRKEGGAHIIIDIPFTTAPQTTEVPPAR